MPDEDTFHAHDRLFRAGLSNPAAAAAFLIDRLPPEVAARIDWTTLKLEPGSFVDPDLRLSESDLLFSAEAAGINVLDSAPAYGLAESRLGSLLASRPDKFHVFTKAGESFSHGTSFWDFSESAIRRSVENSLRLLRSDCLDAVTLHCPRNDLSVLSQSDAPAVLTALKSEGKIRLAGFSVMSLDAGLLAVPSFDYLMVAWNPGFLEHQPVIEAAALANKGILLKKVLSSGTFTTASPADSLRAARLLPGNPIILAGTITPHHLHDNIAALS